MRNNYLIHNSLIILLLLASALSFAQSNKEFSVSGRLIDCDTKEAVEYASVVAYKLPDTVMITGGITDEKGRFILQKIPAGKYIIRASFIGYQTHSSQVEVSKTSYNLNDPLCLKKTGVSLEAVTISEERSEKQISIEKTQIQVSQNISSVSGNIIDVLRSHPSVSIDSDETIYLRGNKSILILLDGVPTSVTSLNAIPSASIESIEIITNPDVRYDSEGTAGIINIVSKKRSVSGSSGAVSLNYGFFNRMNGSLNFNHKRGIWDIHFNYSGKYEKNEIESQLTRTVHWAGTSIEQQILSTQTNLVNSANLMLAANPNAKETYRLSVKSFFPSLYNIQNIEGKYSDSLQNESIFRRKNDITFSRKSVAATLFYKKAIVRNKHEISSELSFSRIKGNRPAEYYTDNELLQKSAGGGAPTNASVQLDYLKALSKNGILEFGAKAFSRWNSFDYHFFDFDISEQLWIENPNLSNDLEHQEYIYSSYLMYSDSLFKTIYCKLGARVEYNTSELIQKSINEKIYREYFFPFPFLLLKHNISSTQNIALSVNRRITRPIYPQLNPFINVIDQMTYETGNKYLNPEVLDKIELNHAFIKEKYQFRTNLFYSEISDYIAHISVLSPPDNLIITYVNGKKKYIAGGELDFAYRFGKIISLNPSFSVFHTRSTGEYNGIDLSTDNLAWAGNLKISIKPEKKTEIQLVINYNSPIALPQFSLNEIYYADIAVRRSFLNNKLSLSLSLTDVLNTRDWVIQADNAIYKIDNYSKTISRFVWIGLSYNFNAYRPQRAQKPEGSEGDGGVIRLGQ